MHQYVLRGVEVQFPYEAYPCQVRQLPDLKVIATEPTALLLTAVGVHGKGDPGPAAGKNRENSTCVVS